MSKTRADIASQIPQSGAAAAVAQNPTVLAVKQALEQLDQIKLEKEQTMGEGQAMHDSINAVDDLMKVNAGSAEKGQVFETYRKKYTEFFAKNEAAEKKKQDITQVIQSHSGELNNLLAQVGNDPAKSAYF